MAPEESLRFFRLQDVGVGGEALTARRGNTISSWQEVFAWGPYYDAEQEA